MSLASRHAYLLVPPLMYTRVARSLACGTTASDRELQLGLPTRPALLVLSHLLAVTYLSRLFAHRLRRRLKYCLTRTYALESLASTGRKNASAHAADRACAPVSASTSAAPQPSLARRAATPAMRPRGGPSRSWRVAGGPERFEACSAREGGEREGRNVRGAHRADTAAVATRDPRWPGDRGAQARRRRHRHRVARGSAGEARVLVDWVRVVR
jgi:hypothetical protein